MAGKGKLLGEAQAGEALGPLDVTIDRAAADRFLQRSGYESALFGPAGEGRDLVPPGAFGDVYTEMLGAKGYYYLNSIQARCKEECVRPIVVGEPLTCTGTIVDAGMTRSGLVFVDVEARVLDAAGRLAFRSQNRLVVTPEESE